MEKKVEYSTKYSSTTKSLSEQNELEMKKLYGEVIRAVNEFQFATNNVVKAIHINNVTRKDNKVEVKSINLDMSNLWR